MQLYGTGFRPVVSNMPIVDIEVVTNTADTSAIGKDTLQLLADELGNLFGSDSGGTWVRLHSIDDGAYAENRAAPGSHARPTFVNILRAELPESSELRREMAGVAEIVARVLNHPRENVHVLYGPAARGRIGFGGVLME